MRENRIRLTGKVVEALPVRGCWVELPNGHRLFGCPARGRNGAGGSGVQPGDRVELAANPFDLSKAEILRVVTD